MKQILQSIFISCCIIQLVSAAPELVLDTDYSPPSSIPDAKDRIYSVSLGHIISKGIIARLDDGTGNTITNTAGLTFSVTSIDATGADPDTFATGGANLCQYANRREYPNSYEGRDYKFYCNTTHPSMVISGIPVHDGILRADGLYHLHTTVPPNNRKFVLSMEYNGSPLSVETNAVAVTVPAAKLVITNYPSSGIDANTDFDIVAEIHDKDDQLVDDGIDSTLPVMMQVASLQDLQLFYNKAPLNDMMFKEMERLSGTDAKRSKSNYAMYIDKRAVGGIVTFSGVRLLDVHTCAKLNLTMRMPNYPHSRMPNTVNSETLNKVVYDYYANDPNTELLVYHYNGTSDGAMTLTECINVTAQTAKTLKIITPTADIKPIIGANFPIEEKIVIHAVDGSDNRVYSGDDSTLNITTTASPAVCLSPDMSVITMADGQAIVEGSICEPNGAVTLTFSATSAIDSNPLATVDVGPINVTNEIHLAAYYMNYDSGSSSQTGAFSDSFATYCVEDINNGYYPSILNGRTLNIHSYNTKHSAQVTTGHIIDMVEHGKKNPHEKVQGIIGFGSNTVTKGVAPLLSIHQIPNIATNEDEYSFSDKTTYPYYSRLSWNMGSLCHSVMMACKNRGWSHMSIVRTVDFTVDNIFYEKAKQFGITIAAEVAIPNAWGATYTDGVFDPYIEKLKDAGVRIAWMFVMPPVSYYFMRDAIDAGIGGIDGWQWNMMGLFGWAFPWANQGPTCMANNITCAQGWVGANCWIVGYDMTMHTPTWKRLVEHHRHAFRKDYFGTVPKLPFTEILAEYSLAYDACIVMTTAMSRIINASETITGPKLTDKIREVEIIESLSGHLKFNEFGDRPGYIGVIVNVNPHPFSWPEHVNAFPPTIAMFSRMIFMESDTATTQWEYNMQAKRPMDLMYGMEIANYTIAFAEYTNKRKFNGSTNGRIGTWSLKLELRPSMEPGPLTTGEVIENSVAPFYCEDGCGGNQTDDYDINQYQFGHCMKFNICKCNDGYYGLSCQHMTCNCVNGQCNIPNVCVCEPGWTGSRCEVPICGFDCGNGRCSGPDTCTCDSGYVGSQCTQSIYVVTIIPTICAILFGIAMFFLIKWLLKRHHLKQALLNLDWLVKWDEVLIGDTRALSIMSTAGDDFATSAKSNMCTWRSQKCYIQNFSCETLNVESESLRLEVIAVRELRHNNLIQFVGACLEYPHVCLLTEVTPKGSLEDLLSNETVKLGWDFKFSLLKDICRGMHFLHLSEIGSHGRLKTSNCLVDNRWTAKISGFGFPTMRYDGPRKKISDDDEPKKLSSLYWTAPELLKGAKSIDDVRMGTKHGDIYSFGIILTEVCNREEPYSQETGFLEPEQILSLVYDKDAPEAAEAKKLWYKSGGDTNKLFRPSVPTANLPEEYAAKQGLQKLMAQCWGSMPELRPSFKNVNEKLNEIYPIKGELIDNLVNMLEKYSSNLEQIVADRTKELVEEKRKTEHLISQMLPKKVVEDLKHGVPVEPESFECVTIFFSDIVGFTNIARNSTPFQVVDLLNDLYTTFDAILDNYDCYKVETIGDAYMIVSGLPVRNGDLHAGEIATCSLDLMAAMVGFKIRHMSGEVLQLRVGMHSGPCVAGVVGLKMPRYCLFGDTVNTASRMESSSMALRIHMSDACAQILKRLGGYHLDCRGEREVKGKGVMTTWWLDGKDGFTKQLPGKDMAASLSQHEFK